MDDKELLVLAAKAAGLPMVFDRHKPMLKTGGDKPGIWRNWNPLTDDGDALRLAVALRIDHEYEDDKVVAWFGAPRPGWDNGQVSTWTEPLGDNPYAAVRRAIVVSAAEIGKLK